MKLTSLLLLACVYTTYGIRLISERSNNIECVICNEAVPYLKYELSKNGTEVAILDHLEPFCKENKECEFIIPMIINHCVDYILDTPGSQLCQNWCD
jgi:hypothetical protein